MTKNHFVFLALYLISCSLFAEESKPQTLYEQFVTMNERFLPPPNGTYVIPPERQKYVRQILSLIGDKTGKAFTNIPSDPSYRLELALACYKIECPIDLKHKLSLSLKKISDQTEDGRNLLFYSVLYRDYQETERLLKLGADPSPRVDYHPLLLSIYMHDWKMYKLLSQYKKQMSEYPNDELFKIWIRGIIPSEVSEKLHKMSKEINRWRYSPLTDVYYLKKYDKPTSEPQHHFVTRFIIELGSINFFQMYEDSKDYYRDVSYPCLIESSDKTYEYSFDQRISTMFVSDNPSWKGTILSLDDNPYENARYLWKMGQGGFPFSSFAKRYFQRNEEIYKKDYLDSFDLNASSKQNYIAVDKINGHWLGVRLKNGNRGWVHSSQANINEINWRYWYPYRLKLKYSKSISCKGVNVIPLAGYPIKVDDVRITFKEYAPMSLPESLYRVDKNNNLIIDMKGKYCNAIEVYIIYKDSNHSHGYTMLPLQ